ncbi:hypothetical protein IQ07DRAFT_104980 [Pyrenochaeta sp. DS3sAY3a]|nr:hypothetical protein IQ07DRAFT_104980 [Pyrenochaeta sp. DS3sAY3a]
MDGSPRSSKRRKLEPPKRIVSSPLTKTPAKRASGRLTNRAVSYTNGIAESEIEEPASQRQSRSTKKGGPAKRPVLENIDIYDDIEGALSVDIAPKPSKRLSTVSREPTVASEDSLDVLQEIVPPPKRKRTQTLKAAEAGKSTPQRSVNGSRSKKVVEVESADEPAVETSPPAKRNPKTRTPVASTRRAASTKKSVGSARKVDKPEEEKVVAKSPSKSLKRRKPQERTEVPETEDEPDEQTSPTKRKSTTSTRRRLGRTDHLGNEEDEHWSDAEDHISVRDNDMDIDGNSVLGSVLDPTEPSPFNKPASAQKEIAAAPLIYGNLPAGRELDLLKTLVMERITGKRPSPLVGLDEEYKSVYQIIEQTVTAGEGNSMLVIGARGSGKTALVNKVLSEVAKNNSGDYHVVRLNGFIHTDDKIALREIWRQLGKEMDIEEDGSGPGKNYADTLTTLLALLSHPSEQTGEITDQVAKAVIFVMDEFDLFAQHPRQTLLYNLFDIAQSRKAPIAVLGLTTRIDVTNSLEKRVKSRFSHRYVHLSLAKTFTAFQEVCKACLTVQTEHLSVEERGILEGGTKSTPTQKGKKGDSKQSILAEWNANISKLFTSPSFLQTHLAPTFYHSKSVPNTLTSFLLPTATLTPTTPFTPTPHLSAPAQKLTLIPHLSTLALSLLIATARLDIIHDSDTANFNMAYDEYVTLASKARIQSAAGGLSAASSTSKVWGKDVARREWEGLVELGFVLPVLAGQAGGFGMVRCDVSLEEVGAVLRGERGVDKGLERWCRSL